METEVRFDSEAAIAVFADAGVVPEVATRDAAEAEPLRGRCKAGEVFITETEDPWITESRQRRASATFRFYVDEAVPEEIEEACDTRSGSFLLRLPSGRLRVTALGTGSPKTQEPPETRTVEVPPGDYALTLFDGSNPNVEAVTAREKALVGDADWRFYERINHFGASGCFFLALGMVFVLIPHTRREYWYFLPLFLLPTCAFTLLRHLPGYARVSKRVREHEAALPQYVVSMRRVESTEGLEGGWYQCK